jgi:hypothetical protein
MPWRPIGRIVKTVVAAIALVLGLWVLLADRYGQFIADGVTNAPLVELVAPTDGIVLPSVDEGELVAAGQEIALHRAATPAGLDNSNAGSPPGETSLVAGVSGVFWDWRTTNNVVTQTGGVVAEVADCTRLFVVTEASEARARGVKVGDKATFTAGKLRWDGSVQRLVAGVPNLTSRYAVALPTTSADTYLIFVKLQVPEGDEQSCAVGLRGRLKFVETGFLHLVLRPRLVGYAGDTGRDLAEGNGPAAEAQTSWK